MRIDERLRALMVQRPDGPLVAWRGWRMTWYGVFFAVRMQGEEPMGSPGDWRDWRAEAQLMALILPPFVAEIPAHHQRAAKDLADDLAWWDTVDLLALRALLALRVVGLDSVHAALERASETHARLAELTIDQPIALPWKTMPHAAQAAWRVAGSPHPEQADVVFAPPWGIVTWMHVRSPSEEDLVALVAALIEDGAMAGVARLADRTRLRASDEPDTPRWIATPFGWLMPCHRAMQVEPAPCRGSAAPHAPINAARARAGPRNDRAPGGADAAQEPTAAGDEPAG